MIDYNENVLRIWLDDKYAIRKYKGVETFVLEYYKYGTDHMPDDIDRSYDIDKLIDRYLKIK